MKKVIIYFITFVLMMSLFCNIVLATEGEVPTETPETVEVPHVEQTAQNVAPTTIKAKAVVKEVGEIQEMHTDYMTDTIQKIKLEILDGNYKAKEYEADYILAYDLNGKLKNQELKVGDKVTVQIMDDEAGTVTVQVEDIVRDNIVLVLATVLFIMLIAIKRKKSIKFIILALVILFSTYLVLIKGAIAGKNVILMSLATSGIILVLNAIIMNGFNRKMLTILVGTTSSVILSGLIGCILVNLAKLSGISEGVIQMSMAMTEIQFSMKHILIASIIISSTGVCINLGQNIVNQLFEQKDRTVDMSRRKILENGIDIGKNLLDNIMNGIVFVLFGISISLILVYLSSNNTIFEIINKETFAELMILLISLSMSTLLTVPVVSGIYALFNYKKNLYRITSENKIDGNRSLKI